MPNAQVSVIMPCYKMGRYIGAAIESVLNQRFSDWELVAVDDAGPDDGTEQIVTSIQKMNPTKRIHWIKLGKNGGVSNARNVAVEAASGEFLAFLDPDDLWHPEHLQKCIETLRANSSLDVVCSPVQVFQGTDPITSSQLWRFSQWQRDAFPYSLGMYNFIQPSGVCMRKDAFDSIGGFNLSADLQHVEDYDLWIRLAIKGYRFQLSDKSTCYYRQHDTAATSDPVLFSRRMEALALEHQQFFTTSVRMVGIKMLKRIEQLECKQPGPIFKLLHRLDQLLGRSLDGKR